MSTHNIHFYGQDKALKMSTKNTNFHGEIRKILIRILYLSGALDDRSLMVHNVCTDQVLFLRKNLLIFSYYAPSFKEVGGAYCFWVVCPSARPSVRHAV